MACSGTDRRERFRGGQIRKVAGFADTTPMAEAEPEEGQPEAMLVSAGSFPPARFVTMPRGLLDRRSLASWPSKRLLGTLHCDRRSFSCRLRPIPSREKLAQFSEWGFAALDYMSSSSRFGRETFGLLAAGAHCSSAARARFNSTKRARMAYTARRIPPPRSFLAGREKTKRRLLPCLCRLSCGLACRHQIIPDLITRN